MKVIAKVYKSLQNIHWRLFFALLVMGLCPTIYTTFRTYLIGELPGDWSFSIAGQLSWVNLLYEIINEAIILPLYFFLGKTNNSQKEFTNKLKTGLVISLAIYSLLSVVIIIFTKPLLFMMATSNAIIEASVTYIRIESIANIFGILFSFASVALISLGKDKLVYLLTIAKLFLCVVSDTFLVSTLPCSANLGVNGIGISNILVNCLLFIGTMIILGKCGYNVFNKEKMDFEWTRDFMEIGSISGFESFVRNIAYMVMVSRMVNVVGEQGTYWVANSFIWGILLLPIIQLGELIKQETANDDEAVNRNSLGYFVITLIVCLFWFIAIPLYKPFIRDVLNFSDVDKLFHLIMVLLGFYVLYAIQNVFDSTFYGRGKTRYMLFESIVTNTIYYGAFFICYLTGVWTPTLFGIAIMFGCGNAFDSIVSFIAYWYFLKRNRYNILNVE